MVNSRPPSAVVATRDSTAMATTTSMSVNPPAAARTGGTVARTGGPGACTGGARARARGIVVRTRAQSLTVTRPVLAWILIV
jgi:hypothetical protein